MNAQHRAGLLPIYHREHSAKKPRFTMTLSPSFVPHELITVLMGVVLNIRQIFTWINEGEAGKMMAREMQTRLIVRPMKGRLLMK